MTKTQTVDELFAELNLELEVGSLLKGLAKQGHVKHDAEVAEVVSEYTEDYFPGMVMMVVEEG